MTILKRFGGDGAFATAVGLLLVAVLVEAWSYPLRASIMILGAVVLGLALVLLQLILIFRTSYRQEKQSEPNGKPREEDGASVDSDADSTLAGQAPNGSQKMIYDTPQLTRTGTSRSYLAGMVDVWSWFLSLLVGIWLIGFHVSVPIFGALYAKLHGGRWLASIIVGLILLVVMEGVFSGLMNTPWPRPAILDIVD